MQKRINIFIILLLITAAFISYHNVLNAKFLWDDQFIIVQNALIRAPLLSFQIFKQDIINSSFTYTIYYRPVQILSYAIDYRLWGLSSFGFHFTNIIIHLFNGLLIFYFTSMITKRKDVPLLAALLFIIHPVNSGTVSYVSSRTDLLFFFFGFLSMTFFVIFKKKKKPILFYFSLLWLVASFLSKEAGVIFPLLILLVDAIVLKEKSGFRIKYHIPGISIAVIYLFIHHMVFSGKYAVVLSTGQILNNIQNYFLLVREFLVLAFFPGALYMRRVVPVTEPGMYIPLIIGLSAAVVLILYLRKIRNLLTFSVIFFFAALIPFLFISGYFKVIAEHWMYLSGFGVFLFMSLVFSRIYEMRGRFARAAMLILLLVTIIFYSRVTIRQSHYWLDDITLSDQVLEYSGTDMPAMHFKAVSLLKSGEEEKSLEIMKSYAEEYSTSPRAWYIKGRINLVSGNVDQAISDFNRSLEINMEYDNGYLGLAMAGFMQERHAEGIKFLERTIEINPRHSEAMLILAAAYSEAGDNKKALEITTRARKINPYDYNVIINQGTAYSRLGNLPEAAKCYLKATVLYPERPKAYYNLGSVFSSGGQKEEAKKWLRKAITLDPQFTKAIELLDQISAK